MVVNQKDDISVYHNQDQGFRDVMHGWLNRLGDMWEGETGGGRQRQMKIHCSQPSEKKMILYDDDTF